MTDRIPIPMGIPWDQYDPRLSHSHAHVYSEYRTCVDAAYNGVRYLGLTDHTTAPPANSANPTD